MCIDVFYLTGKFLYQCLNVLCAQISLVITVSIHIQCILNIRTPNSLFHVYTLRDVFGKHNVDSGACALFVEIHFCLANNFKTGSIVSISIRCIFINV